MERRSFVQSMMAGLAGLFCSKLEPAPASPAVAPVEGPYAPPPTNHELGFWTELHPVTPGLLGYLRKYRPSAVAPIERAMQLLGSNQIMWVTRHRGNERLGLRFMGCSDLGEHGDKALDDSGDLLLEEGPLADLVWPLPIPWATPIENWRHFAATAPHCAENLSGGAHLFLDGELWKLEPDWILNNDLHRVSCYAKRDGFWLNFTLPSGKILSRDIDELATWELTGAWTEPPERCSWPLTRDQAWHRLTWGNRWRVPGHRLFDTVGIPKDLWQYWQRTWAKRPDEMGLDPTQVLQRHGQLTLFGYKVQLVGNDRLWFGWWPERPGGLVDWYDLAQWGPTAVVREPRPS